MLTILDSLISVKMAENTEQDANPVIELLHSSQHCPRGGYKFCSQGNIDSSPS